MRWRQLFLMTMQNKVISSSTLPPSSSLLQKYLANSEWTLRKRLEYRKGGTFGTWTGSAHFREDPVRCDTLLYTEDGRLQFDDPTIGGGKAVPSSGRPLAFVFPEKPVEKPAEVYFVEGSGLRFFHSLPFSTFCGEASAECLGECSFDHLCVKDLYSGTFEICDQDTFTIHWHVYGPTKDGDISQQYTRKRQLQ